MSAEVHNSESHQFIISGWLEGSIPVALLPLLDSIIVTSKLTPESQGLEIPYNIWAHPSSDQKFGASCRSYAVCMLTDEWHGIQSFTRVHTDRRKCLTIPAAKTHRCCSSWLFVKRDCETRGIAGSTRMSIGFGSSAI